MYLTCRLFITVKIIVVNILIPTSSNIRGEHKFLNICSSNCVLNLICSLSDFMVSLNMSYKYIVTVMLYLSCCDVLLV
jgi:hypothetical protein